MAAVGAIGRVGLGEERLDVKSLALTPDVALTPDARSLNDRGQKGGVS
jgi:hypothetical protein